MFEDLFALGLGGIYSLLILSLTFFFLLAIRLRSVDNKIITLYEETGAEFAKISETLSTVEFIEDYSKHLEYIV